MNVTVIKSKRKTFAIQINTDLSVTVRAPLRASKQDIEKILKEKEAWIWKHINGIKEDNQQIEKLSNEELEQLKKSAFNVIQDKVIYFANKMGVNYGRITIRVQRTRWGSCSSKGNLNFNCLLMLAPSEVIDYVVVHELCHIKEMNHSNAFWNEVEKVLPNYREQRRWLKEQGHILMQRI